MKMSQEELKLAKISLVDRAGAHGPGNPALAGPLITPVIKIAS